MLLRESGMHIRSAKRNIMRGFQVLFATLLIAAFAAPKLQAADMKPEELIAKHLESIGTAEARNAVKTRTLHGNASMTVIAGGSGTLTGDARLDSEGQETFFRLNLENPQYRGEEFVFDGKKVNVAMFKPGVWSPIGMFMRAQDSILREGLFGGTLISGWSLLDVADRKPKLSYDGLKTVNGKSLHQLTYKMRHGDVSVRLYFEPDTYRHVYTIYTLTRTSGLGTNGAGNPDLPEGPAMGGMGAQSAEVRTARQQETRLRLEESFSDFVAFNGVTLPTTWKVTYTSEGGKESQVHEYLVRANRIENNAKLENADFKASENPKK
jgi:hypothetical protein